MAVTNSKRLKRCHDLYYEDSDGPDVVGEWFRFWDASQRTATIELRCATAEERDRIIEQLRERFMDARIESIK